MDPRRAAAIWFIAIARRRRKRRALIANPKLQNAEATFMLKGDFEFQALFRLNKIVFGMVVEAIRPHVEYHRYVT